MNQASFQRVADPRRTKVIALMQDIRLGLNDCQLMGKYQISRQNLAMVRDKLIAAGHIQPPQVPLPKAVREPQFLIRKRVTKETLFTGKARSLVALVESAVRAEVSLERANLRSAKLRAANISGICLAGSDLSQSDMSDSDLSRGDLRETDLVMANLSGANLTGADLMGSSMMSTNLTGARLARANLAGVDFTGADLTDADLSYCNLDGANLTEARMDGAKLEGVRFFRVTKNKMAEEKAEKSIARKTFLSSPRGLMLLQLAWLVIMPFGFMVFGISMLWSLLMLLSLVLIALQTAVTYKTMSGWLMLVFPFQMLMILVLSAITGAMVVW